MPRDLMLSVDTAWGTRPHHIEVIHTIDAGAPCYILKLVPAGEPRQGITPVNDPLRFGFYGGDWWRIEGDWEDQAALDRLTLDPAWGLRNHHRVKPLPRFAGGGRFSPGLKLIICDKDDPRRFGSFRNSTWRLEGDE